MRVIVREAAFADLKRIRDWISQDNPRAATSVIGRILDAVERLGVFPRLGRHGKAPGTREWVVRGLPYIIVYTRILTSLSLWRSFTAHGIVSFPSRRRKT